MSVSSLSSEWAMCEYRLGIAVPLVKLGNAAAGGSHFLIMCSNSFTLLVYFAHVLQVIRCVWIIVGIISMNFSILDLAI